VDSAQVYVGMDIGTAKPDAVTRRRVPHHLIDILEPTQSYSAARFASDAMRAIAEIRARGRIPLLVGGTMLYFKALLEGLSPLPSADPSTRAALEARATEEGWPALHAELSRVDPAAAARIHSADAQRIQRALEVFMTTGTPLSKLHASRTAPELGDTVSIALVPADRGKLHAIIRERFQAMLAAGLVDEVQRLRRRYALTAEMPSMRCVGYRQVWQVIEGEAPAGRLLERGTAATRQLAKRQFTWLRAIGGVAIDPWTSAAVESMSELILECMAAQTR
jgi:tRNA dimethylallyltransferase